MKLFVAMLVVLALPWQLSAQVYAQTSPTITLSNTNATPGSYITAEIQGMSASQPYTLSVNFPTPAIQTISADAGGAFSYTFQIPPGTPAERYTLALFAGTTVSGMSLASQTFQVSAPPTTGAALNISPSSVVKPGNALTVTAYGLPGSTTVFVQLPLMSVSGPSETQGQTLTTRADGTLTTMFTLPADVRNGPYTITVYAGSDATGAVLATANIAVSPAATIALAPSTSVAGTASHITVSGTGFGGNETVTISYLAALSAGTTTLQATSIQADGNGAFTNASLPVPATIVPGSYTVSAAGGTSGLQADAQLTVTPHPTITINPVTVLPSGIIVVTGQLFAPNGSVTVNANFPTGTNTVAQSVEATVSASGTFTTQLSVPANTSEGTVTITATESQSPAGPLTATASVAIRGIRGTIAVVPLTAAPGAIVTINGSGFAPGPNAPVTISASIPLIGGGSQLLSSTQDPDSNGAFHGAAAAELVIPTDAAPGRVMVTATQPTSGGTASTTFTVSTAPPSPTPLPTLTTTPTPSPTPTPTPTSTPHPTPAPVHHIVPRVKRLSEWYHVVHAGTFNHVEVQAKVKARYGIWVHILFPSGLHWDYYEHTDNRGHWARSFDVPFNTVSRYSNRAHVEVQLWKGKYFAKAFTYFSIIP